MWEVILAAILISGLLCGISLFVGSACNAIPDPNEKQIPPWEELE